MPHFFINKENISGNTVLITDKSDINHILNVLRYSKKDKLILKAPDNMVYEVVIKGVTPEVIECEVNDSYVSDKVLKTNITLAQSVIKSQKQDFLIQKATELGVKEIIPFVSKNTVVKFPSDKDKARKVQRWQKIVYESSKQCERGDLARINPIASFDEILALEGFDLKVLCSEKKADISIKQFLQEEKTSFLREQPSQKGDEIHSLNDAAILLIIGPEGGWDDVEIEKFLAAGITPVTLGKLIYRAETAATAALSHIIYEFEL